MSKHQREIAVIVTVLLILAVLVVAVNIRAGRVRQEVDATIQSQLGNIELTVRADQ